MVKVSVWAPHLYYIFTGLFSGLSWDFFSFGVIFFVPKGLVRTPYRGRWTTFFWWPER
jgi:hypothetical protein